MKSVSIGARLVAVVTAVVLALTAMLGVLTVTTDTAYAAPESSAAEVSTDGSQPATLSDATQGEPEESGGLAAILPDMYEFIPMLIAFIILWIILAKFGWPIFNNMLTKRENTIRTALQKSEEAQIKAEETLQEYQKQLADAKAEAAAIIANARQAADSIKADLTAQAQAEAADIVAKAKDAVEAEKRQALVELQSTVADSAVGLARRLVVDGLDENQQRQLIARYLQESGSFNGN